ncbi:MAG: hypothetical protein H0T18_04045, partial [Chloroflexia bacterium]|nr:hypothetical protein [Chloroflexia bacterium]
MVQQREKPSLKFEGSKREQDIASKGLHLMLARGMFMSSDAPIRVSISALAEYLDSQGEKNALNLLQSAAGLNPGVFAVEEVDGESFLVTTREGAVPVQVSGVENHSFAARFLTPLPRPERTSGARSRPRPHEVVVDVLAGMSLASEDESGALGAADASEPLAIEDAPSVVARTIT